MPSRERLTALPPPKAQAQRLQDKSGYKSPLGVLDSVTRILGKTADPASKKRLEQWLKRPDAEAISDDAKQRGTWLHTCTEEWINAFTEGRELPDFKSFAYGGYWRCMRPFLEEHWVQTVALERAVYHPTRFAGSFDALGYSSFTTREDVTPEDASHELCLFDWKTSKKPRDEKLVFDYKCQLGAYAKAIDYVYGVRPERALLVIARPHGNFPDIWELTGDELWEFGDKFIQRANNYYITEHNFER
jgi:hypothetical protein